MDEHKLRKVRNIAIVAHVDHGKTTLVDKLLQQSGILDNKTQGIERVMDSNELERERGITILAKNTAVDWQGYRINIVDTPGHADFGGEVERILSMVDAVLLLVDAVEGPMPQTRFVTQKAFSYGLQPIVVINKIDRPGSRVDWVINQVFELFDSLGATEEQLDFHVIYASALQGYAVLDLTAERVDMSPLFQEIVNLVPAPKGSPDAPLQMQITSLDYSSYVGAIGVGLIHQGQIKPGNEVVVVNAEGEQRKAKILQVLGYLGLSRTPVSAAQAGDIVAIAGVDGIRAADTLCAPDHVVPLAPLAVDQATVSMTFQVNDSPFAGIDGQYVTSRQLEARLEKELHYNVALHVEPTASPDKWRVLGRGELHLSILIETMRREGYELAVSRPQVVTKEIDGCLHEPIEHVVIDIQDSVQGEIMTRLGERGASLVSMEPDGKGRVRLDYTVAARALIGFRAEFVTLTSGAGLISQVFDHYAPVKPLKKTRARSQGVLIANSAGVATAFALWNLQNRGRLLITPQTKVYEGMIIGINAHSNDLVVNVSKGKQLTNIRASGADDAIVLTPAIKHTLEQAMSFIADDEVIEITPNHIRLRKKILTENGRKKAGRKSE